MANPPRKLFYQVHFNTQNKLVVKPSSREERKLKDICVHFTELEVSLYKQISLRKRMVIDFSLNYLPKGTNNQAT